jgi:Lipopolysaccharide kinase (Kdo/WaaP) family
MHASEQMAPAGKSGWHFHSPAYGLAKSLRAELLVIAENTIAGKPGTPYHRSRQASTWRVTVGGAARLRVYVKLLAAPHGISRLKRIITGSRGAHLEVITPALDDAGFSAPPILLRAKDRHGSELIVTLEAAGDGALRTLADLSDGPLALKREILRRIGGEIARLHRCGFVHGDLTPFNILLIRGEPLRLALIDNDRTRRIPIVTGQRMRLRNLVQLGRFAMCGISRTDKLRVIHGYTEMLNPSARRDIIGRANAMLNRRLRRDHGLTVITAIPEGSPHDLAMIDA